MMSEVFHSERPHRRKDGEQKMLACRQHTWDGVQGSAVVMVGQKRHSLCLGPLGLSTTAYNNSISGQDEDFKAFYLTLISASHRNKNM